MKSRFLILFGLLVGLSMVISACGPSGAPEEVYILTETTAEPPGKTGTVEASALPAGVQASAEPVMPAGHLGTDGAHAGVACESCHKNGVYKGTASTCVSCHTEPELHSGQFGTDCTICHSTTSWSSADYNGPHTFPMNHNGANGQCATCHPDNLTTFTCFGCHNYEYLAGEHDEEGVSDLNNCMECHEAGRKPDD